MALFGPFSTVRDRCVRWPEFSAAFAYVAEALAPGSPARERIQTLAEGASHREGLPDGAHAVEMAYRTKRPQEGFFESHQKFIDVQVIVSGEEVMEAAAAGPLGVMEAYDEAKDMTHHADPAAASRLRLRAGDVAVFWPEDAHKPSIAVDGPALVRKTVVKVPAPA